MKEFLRIVTYVHVCDCGCNEVTLIYFLGFTSKSCLID